MGGTSTSSQTQASTTAPWTAAQPDLTSILGSLGPLITGSGVTPQEQSDVNTIGANANSANTYSPQINAYVQSLLGGGGATNQLPSVTQAMTNYTNQMNPLANNTNYDPMQTPGFANNINQIGTDVTNQVNSQFAAAGRSGSGMNQQDLARGIAAGEAPVIANQYNANVANQQGAANNLFAGSNTSNALISGLQQQAVANQGTGVAAIPTAQAAPSYGASTNLALQQFLQQLPAQNLGLLANIGVPIAGLGSSSTGQSNGTNTMSGAQQFATILQGIGSLIPKGPTTLNF
jgi:hypothetical protein